jgi:hypothetical protein
MKKAAIYLFIFFFTTHMLSQELFAISPIKYPKTESQVQEDGRVLFKKFDITISNNKEIFYKDKFIYKCDFTEYYEYLIEVFSNDRNFLLVTPLPIIKGIATPYNIVGLPICISII